MIVGVDKIIRDVRSAIDMNTDNSQLLLEEDSDTLSLDTIISQKLCDGVRLVESEAPLHLLEHGHHLRGDIRWEENNSGWILLPDDFLRLISFRMSDWSQSINNVIDSTNPLYLQQRSRWGGLRGTPELPVCAIVQRNEGLSLEFYSCHNTSATIDDSLYLPLPTIDRNGGIDICERCYPACIYRIASLVLSTLKDEQASVMLELSKTVMI